jgi:anti-sigma B factor antagonist
MDSDVSTEVPMQADNFGEQFGIQYHLQDKGVAIIRLNGRIDRKAVHGLSTTIKHIYHQKHFRLISDCGAMTYIASAGIGAIAGAITEAQANGGNLVLIKPSDEVKKIIELLGLNELIPMTSSLKEALENFDWWRSRS